MTLRSIQKQDEPGLSIIGRYFTENTVTHRAEDLYTKRGPAKNNQTITGTYGFNTNYSALHTKTYDYVTNVHNQQRTSFLAKTKT